jgi:capsular exopolysaccharide synthesis family protein
LDLAAAKDGPTSLADYAAIIWRWRLLVLPIMLAVPLTAVGLLHLETPRYQASADVLVRSDDVSAITGLLNSGGNQDPQRFLDTQARLARLPAVAADALDGAKIKMTTAEFLAVSSVSADTSSDILTFFAQDATPSRAMLLANAYAVAYTTYRATLDRKPLEHALASLNEELGKLRRQQNTGGPLYAGLVAQRRQIVTLLAVPGQTAVVVADASRAPKIRPRLKVGVLVGGPAGMLLAIGLALLMEGVVKRPRSSEEVIRRLGLRVLGRIPQTIDSKDGVVTLTRPASLDAEAYRRLRLNFEHAIAEGSKVFAVTSASPQEGKSTVAANLAVTLARSGRSVLLVECDPMRPVLRERLGLGPAQGLTELALGHASIADTITVIPLAASRLPRDRSLSPVQPRPGSESLKVITCNPTAVELGDYVISIRLESLIAQLANEADVVILDTAPVLTSLGAGVSALADGLVVVANVEVLRRPVLEQLVEALEDVPSPKLGVVLTGVGQNAISYGYYSYAPTAAAVDGGDRPERASAGSRAQGSTSG